MCKSNGSPSTNRVWDAVNFGVSKIELEPCIHQIHVLRYVVTNFQLYLEYLAWNRKIDFKILLSIILFNVKTHTLRRKNQFNKIRVFCKITKRFACRDIMPTTQIISTLYTKGDHKTFIKTSCSRVVCGPLMREQ